MYLLLSTSVASLSWVSSRQTKHSLSGTTAVSSVSEVVEVDGFIKKNMVLFL
jgi:hypothetical protein